MSRVADALSFVSQIAPALFELGRDLYKRHQGDLIPALKELHLIREHGTTYLKTSERLRQEMADAKAAEEDTQPGKTAR